MPRRQPEVVLALDIGATKFAAGLIDLKGALLESHQTMIDKHDDADGVFEQLVTLSRRLIAAATTRKVKVVACGVGCAGPITPNIDTVSPLNLHLWREFPLRSRLSEALGLEIAGDLDTKALARGEGWVGAAVGERNYLAMVVSTGIGGGIVLNGELLEGSTGNAGHIGHVVVFPDGHPCSCGGTGCVEAEASGTAIEAITGRPPTEASPVVIERTGMLVGRAVASVMNLLELPLAVVAGSMALGFGDPFFEAAQAELDANAHVGDVRCEIRPAGLGGDAPLVGAGAVAWRALGRIA